MNEKAKTKKKLLVRGLNLIIMTLFGISSLYLIYNIMLLSGVEDFIRYIGIGIIVILFLIIFSISLRVSKRRRFKPLLLVFVITILFTCIFTLGGYYINRAFSSINNMNKGESNYGTSLIALDDSNINNVSDLKNKKIGIISDKDSIEGYIISYEIIKDENINEKNLVKYDDFLSMLNDLYDEKVDAIFVSSSYVAMFSSFDNFKEIKSETKVITSKTKTIEKKDTATKPSYSNEIKEPFTMLIMGIDSTEDDIKSATSFNGDSLILVTFNPKTLNTTMLSIPRDTFVPIMCFAGHKQNKITHAAWYGESCMMKTIENFTGIDINYYVKINFKGVVKLVDAVGGVEVDVPYSFCEQNSNRQWGKNTVYVEKGLQTLSGEQALAFARNRHPNPDMCKKKWTNYYSDDFVRGQNQQTVIKALVSKLKTIRDVNKLYEILDLIEKSMDTNLTTNQILSFYNIGKDILARSKTNDDILNFQKLYLKTYGAYIYDEGMKMELSDQIYYKGSLNEVVDAMKINLGFKDPTIIKDFSFSVSEVYEEKVIGKGTYNESSIALVPNFASYSKSTATSWGIKNGVDITFKTYETSEYRYSNGQIINQSVPRNSLVSIAKTKGITLTIVSKIVSTTPSKIDCTDEDNKDNQVCKVPDFEGKSLSNVTTWQNKLTTNSVSVVKIYETTDDESKNNIVKIQEGLDAGDNLYDASSRNLTITYYKYVDPAIESSGI
jgi:LCP family protein required for cell wall assembly